jgi:hypothetical protein
MLKHTVRVTAVRCRANMFAYLRYDSFEVQVEGLATWHRISLSLSLSLSKGRTIAQAPSPLVWLSSD